MNMLKRISALILSFITLISLISCGKEKEPEPEEYYSATFFAMDTEITVKLARRTGETDEDENALFHDEAYLSSVIKECANLVSEYESALSRTKDDSVISEINKETDYFFDLDPEVLALIKESNEISELTAGAFDVTVGTVTELWNVTSDGADVPSDESIEEAVSHVGYEKIETDGATLRKTDRKTKIDLGAIGKGYALGKMIDHLRASDVDYGIVSFGGNVGAFGKKPTTGTFKVAITNALDTSKVIGYVFVDDEFVSVSADYERNFVKDGVVYGHIFDPETGRPAKSDVISVAVLSENSAYADALSTALFVLGTDGIKDLYKALAGTDVAFEAVAQLEDGSVYLTEGLSGDGGFEEYKEPETTAES